MAQLVPTNIPPSEQLKMLLQLRSQQPDRADEIDAAICDRFLQTQAIIVLDAVGFSRLTQEQGIIPALQEICRLRDVATPILEAKSGIVFKAEADNLYVRFDNSDAALQAADHLLAVFKAADLHASIGIGYGEVLVVGDHDLYGDEMNLASKLGEDLAKDDEILLTEAAHDFLVESTQLFDVFTHEISKVTLTVYQLKR